MDRSAPHDRPASFDQALIASLPDLKRYCLRLAGTDGADLLQDVMVRAVAYWDRFVEGTNMPGWLRTIARHHRANQWRSCGQRKYELPLVLNAEGAYLYPDTALVSGGQDIHVDLEDLMDVMETKLNPMQREALTRIALGDEYQEVADAVGCNLGTVKSRVNRGRHILTEHFAA